MEGLHAFLGASKNSWLRKTDEELIESYQNYYAKERGTLLHAQAAMDIKLGLTRPKGDNTFNKYVNDGIKYGMDPEVILYYSEFCFGTADTISFKQNYLRIHDLKTGKVPAHIEQLLVYAALFCLEYDIKPRSMKGVELRIYQNDNILYLNPTSEEIEEVMRRIIECDKLLRKESSEGE